MEKTFLLRLLDGAPKLLRHGYALFFILLGWLIFSADGLESAELLTRAGGLFGIGMPLFGDGTLYELLRSLPSFIIMAVGATPWVKGLFGALGKKRPAVYLAARNILALCGILLSTAYLAGAEYNPFLYFRF